MKRNIYPNIEDAKKSARRLKIKSSLDYFRSYKKDPKLPSSPRKFYKNDWNGWRDFLSQEPQLFYDYISAQKAIKNLGIENSTVYRTKYKLDKKLPSNPQLIYKTVWTNWPDFFGKRKARVYDSYREAAKSAAKLGACSRDVYYKIYTKDPLLPKHPNVRYRANWKGWTAYLGKTKKSFYENYDEASEAARKLGIKSWDEYRKRYSEDLRLCSAPDFYYKDSWKGMSDFLGHSRKKFYETYTEASQASCRLKITKSEEYSKRYKEDPKLPSEPQNYYRHDWVDWQNFLQAEKMSPFYKNYDLARKSAHNLNIKSSLDYKKRYKSDPLLPSSPEIMYSKHWSGWKDFLLPEKINEIGTFKRACIVLGIRNSQHYREVRRTNPILPAKPEKMDGWTTWYDALNIPKLYSYDELRKLVRSNGIKTLKQYTQYRIESHDPRLAVKPEGYYKNKGWTNAYDFFGACRPYQVKYFTQEWILWADKIEEFLKSARGGDTKAKDLCEFVREYIEPNDFEECPLEFLTRGSTNIQPMLHLFEQVPVTRKKKWIFSINEFLDWIISNYLILEDTETGEVTHIKGAKNPFSHVNFSGEVAPQVINETDKMALPYQYVKQGREWMFPSDSIEKKLSYRDLAHLHHFSSDWVKINDNSLLDKNDPDCVFKVENGKTFLWFPTYWTYTYSLMQLPARGMQIVYCDSGEADKELADFKNGKVIWNKNRTMLAGLTNQQGMVSKSGQGEFGVHYTSNKTKFDGSGYTIPFMPIELAYWLVKLRKWQQKYNPLKEPTKWLDCERTNLNEVQRKQKGSNCFLFRDYLEKEPGTFGGRLTTRLASALYFSGKNDIKMATYQGLKYNQSIKELEKTQTIPLSHFKSPYTPHSMRVSLINAYAYELGIPLEVIMKLVGHSSIIMSIYYLKSDKTGANLREKMELGEKEALSKATQTLRSFVEQQRIEEVKSQLVGSSVDLLSSLDNARPASSYQWKDFGICPVGGAFCSEGGCPVATKANIYHPVPAGYLGEQNCFQCRFFITGPAFLVGLAAMFNEISLAVNTQSIRYTSLGQKLDDIAEKIDVIDHQLYKIKADSSEKSTLESDRRKLVGERIHLNSEIETRAKKLDLYLSDMNVIHRHIHNCQILMRNPKENTENHYQLIVPHEFTLGVDLDEVSNFHQLSEVCSNAELYHSCSDDLAVTRRSQMLDKMMVENGIQPQLFLLSEEEQLLVGNQLIELMLTRLKGWENVDRLIDGSLTLKDLSIDNQFDEKMIRELFEKSQPLKRIG
ncbi:gamma-mobile-trio integrase GmtZ [Photobacterium swingsii]|uniref:gamma-mobile-trio integrase GmtZ n=1 Tax=Photobacterium swingsii TaxID=680026 RepID=UPI001FD30705|nr:VPA1269 family protein [Photobacterium swingsii]